MLESIKLSALGWLAHRGRSESGPQAPIIACCRSDHKLVIHTPQKHHTIPVLLKKKVGFGVSFQHAVDRASGAFAWKNLLTIAQYNRRTSSQEQYRAQGDKGWHQILGQFSRKL